MEDFRLIKIKLIHMIRKGIEGRSTRRIIFIILKIQIIKGAISVLKHMKRPIKNIKKITTSIRVETGIKKDGTTGRMPKLRKIITVIYSKNRDSKIKITKHLRIGSVSKEVNLIKARTHILKSKGQESTALQKKNSK